MYRHTTKTRVQSQKDLHKNALKGLRDVKLDLCESVSHHPYARVLPPMSLYIIREVMSGICGSEIEPDLYNRQIHNIATWCSRDVILRCCILTPELVTCAVSLPTSMTFPCNMEKQELVRSLNNATPCTITPLRYTCRLMGRMTPYMVDAVGADDEAVITHVNLTSTRIVFFYTDRDRYQFYHLTRESLQLLSYFVPEDSIMIDLSESRKFKMTVASNEESSSPNKNTCIMVSYDGFIRILGLVTPARRVCHALNKSIHTISQSVSWPAFVSSLEPGDVTPF
ncbi:hypothetical protein GGR52DRAFT_256451 [Hypoxylon sp. FL1284]|nr:hypothetical protein GGR52DRAFT_256451 [Hypoxylon sp. FL1284]